MAVIFYRVSMAYIYRVKAAQTSYKKVMSTLPDGVQGVSLADIKTPVKYRERVSKKVAFLLTVILILIALSLGVCPKFCVN